MKKSIAALLFFSLALSAAAAAQSKSRKPMGRSARSANVDALAKQVRKELVTLPFYGVFDWLEANVETDGTVQLRGEVVRPSTKSDAAKRVEKIEGVDKVENKIEVLPLSNFDDQLRQRVYRALFAQNSPLFRYGQGTVPSIHIILRNGRLTLKGVVSTKTDSDQAYIRARGVDGLFDVKNELTVEKDGKSKS